MLKMQCPMLKMDPPQKMAWTPPSLKDFLHKNNYLISRIFYFRVFVRVDKSILLLFVKTNLKSHKLIFLCSLASRIRMND